MSFEIPYNTLSRQYQHEIQHHLRRERIYDPDYGLSKDPHWYAKLDKDAIIGFLCRFRRQMIAGAEWSVEARTEHPKDKAAARIIEILMGEIKNFQEARYLLSDAFLKGSTWARIGGRKKRILVPGMGPLDFWVVTQLRDADKRRFELRKDLQTASRPLHEQEWNWVFSADALTNIANWQKVNPRHWVRHTYENREQGLGWGVGLAGPLYFLLLVKSESFTRNFQFMDRWANGIITATVKELAHGQVDSTVLTRMREWVKVLEKMRSEHILVHGDADGIKVYDAPTGGNNAASDLRDYCDNAASRLVLGSVLPTGGATDKGSLARAAVETDSTKSIITFDRNKLSESLGTLIDLLWEANTPIFGYLGLRDANKPRFKINFQQNYDAAERAETAAKLVEQGLGSMMSKKQVIELSGFRVADEAEETVTPREAKHDIQDKEKSSGGDRAEASPGFDKAAVSSALDIVKSVSNSEIPPETAAMMLATFFPNIPGESAAAMVRPAAEHALRNKEAKRQEMEAKRDSMSAPAVEDRISRSPSFN